MRVILVALLIGVLLVAPACGGSDGSSGGSAKLETISNVEQFTRAFDGSAGHARLVLLLSPT